jgi:hypothetical protein
VSISRKTIREEWRIKLDQARSSGLAAAAWCREQGIPYYQFLYWSRKFKNKSKLKDIFVEIADETSITSGIILECCEVYIHLSSDFDSKTLHRCLELLRRN